MNCLFCNELEKNYKPDKGVDYVCGSCVILLASADQDDLRRAHGKAIATGYLNKANAIESFLKEEVEDGKRPTKSIRRNIDRKRAARTIRN